jgi:hypothetical protein
MEVGLVRLVRSRRTLVLTLLVALVGGALLSGTGSALAQEPAPPPNPSDDDLRRSREAVDARASRSSGLVASVSRPSGPVSRPCR